MGGPGEAQPAEIFYGTVAQPAATNFLQNQPDNFFYSAAQPVEDCYQTAEYSNTLNYAAGNEEFQYDVPELDPRLLQPQGNPEEPVIPFDPVA